jgi:adenosylcobinamide-GDP ribazoletransferase
MARQWIYFLTAIQFFTRIPTGAWFAYKPMYLQKSARYFPWVGLLVGLTAAVTFYYLQMVVSSSLAIATSMLVTILLTGAFHEDGWADVCDAFGGGWTKEKILTIMKDSRLGTYGTVGLIAMLGAKYLLLQELVTYLTVNEVALVMLGTHAYSRLMAVMMMQLLPYVADIDASKSKPLANQQLQWYELLIAAVGGVFIWYFFDPVWWLALIPSVFILLYLVWYFKKWIGGYTGDCLGATQQVTEISCYASFIIIWKFILFGILPL